MSEADLVDGVLGVFRLLGVAVGLHLGLHLDQDFGMREQIGMELSVGWAGEVAQPRRAEDGAGRDHRSQEPGERRYPPLAVQRRLSFNRGVTIATMSFARCHSGEPSGSSLAARLAKTSVAGLLSA